MIDLGDLIRFHRRQANLSQVDLAQISGVSRIVIQSIEAGEDGIRWRNLCAILEVLNISLVPRGPLVDAWLETQPPTNIDSDEETI